ncbi:MAG: phosphoenolpyruvate--protein phosphotransferase [Candidatus Zixiibacteriota bacterium]
MSAKRRVIRGTSISKGIVLGQARVVIPGDTEVLEFSIPQSRVNAEIEALDRAIESTVADLETLRESAGKRIGGPIAKIFDAQLLIASDYDFLKKVKQGIASSRRNAGFVYHSLVQQTTTPLRKSADYYMRQMVVDIEAVASKVLSHLAGTETAEPILAANTILVGKMFTPNDIVSYRRRRAVGFLVSEGGEDSHMALMARSLMIPVVLAKEEWRKIANNSRIILDGSTGVAIVNPTDSDWTEYQHRKRRLGPAAITRIRRLKEIPPVTADGRQVTVGANLTLPGPADDILAEQNIPIGLYRTEFLYLSHNHFPDEETQFKYYSQVAEKFTGAGVVLRTFDLGYDKTTADNNWPRENNPALGWRGIRPMLDLSHLFKTQVRAMLRASVRRNLKIMLPMVSELSELERAGRLIAQVKFQLRKEKVPFDEEIDVGIMVEVPAAAMMADKLARLVDFMSIGTNDLTQYMLAADRTNYKVADLYCPYHPSVLQLIATTVQACKKHGLPVSVCGEMAGDILALPLFIGLEVDMLSMSPARIFDLCRAVRKIDSGLVAPLVSSVLSSGSVREVVGKLQKYREAIQRS